MAQRFLEDPAGFGTGYPIIGGNSLALSQADPVYINTSGFLVSQTTSDKILGYSLDTITTLAADNQTNAMVCPRYCYADFVLMVYPMAAAAAVTQTQIGEYTDFSGTTSGSFTLNASSSATVGQVLIVGLNPNNNGSTSAGTATELSEAVVRAAFLQSYTAASS